MDKLMIMALILGLITASGCLFDNMPVMGGDCYPHCGECWVTGDTCEDWEIAKEHADVTEDTESTEDEEDAD